MSRRPLAVAAGLLCLATLTGCGTGLKAQTYQRHTYDFVNADQGDVAIRNLAVDAPTGSGGVFAQGSTAKISGSFVSQGDQDDTLTGATSSVAGSVTLEQGGRTVTQIPVPSLGAATDWLLALTGTTRELRPGSYVDVTLTFAKAGRTTLQVPVRSNAASGGSPSATSTPVASFAPEG